jgi:hypothetical protein
MHSSVGEEAVAAFDALDAALDRVDAVHWDALTVREHGAMLERSERAHRRFPAHQHALINQLCARAAPEEIGGALHRVLADRLHITPPRRAGASVTPNSSARASA